MISSDIGVHDRVLRRVLKSASDFSFERTPPEMGATIHRIIREETGEADPYRSVKTDSNRIALDILPRLRDRITDSEDPFATALRLAIAGNIMDFAIMTSLDESFIVETIEGALTSPLSIDDVDELKAAVEAASSILYLCDNAGEIVLDGLLLEQLPRERVTVVVRGSPVLNDATMEDAEVAGISSLASVIDNGSDTPGTLLEECSPDFRARFWQADVVISKGQGNYETLSGIDREVFHLLKAKCSIASRDLGCEVGDIVAARIDARRV
jgi:uncharacterized protein with ATP-grasp and redox domains